MKGRIFVFGLVLCLIFVAFTMAEGNDTNSTDLNNTNNSGANASSNSSRNCQALNHRIEGRLRQFDEGRDGHLRRFVNLRDRLGNMTDKLEQRGFNVSQARADLTILDEKILKFDEDYALFIQKLNDTRKFVCSHSNGSFKSSLDAAKAQLKIVRQDAEDIREFIKKIVRADFKDLRIERRDERLENRIDRLKNITQRLENRRQMMNSSGDDSEENSS